MKINRIPRFTCALFVAAALVACGGGLGDATGSTCPTTSTLTYANRAAAAGPKAVNTYMPDGASVDEAERRKLGEWLACGAPE